MQLSVFLDPQDKAVIRAAKQAGINDAWIAAAQAPPVYKLAVDWQVALPLHPEYRTLPMVWYVPPLSLIMDHIQNEEQLSAEGYFTALDSMRIPTAYLASILAAGDVSLVRRALARLMAMRIHMRQREVGDLDDSAAIREADMTASEIEEMARLLAVAKYNERFVIPTGRREGDPDLTAAQGSCSLEGLAPPEGRRRSTRRRTRN